VCSLTRADVGRPIATPATPPSGRYRRRMRRELAGSQKGKPYGQRAQAETVVSMLKRNLGDALRARSPRMRRREHAFKAVVHDLMLARRRSGGSRQSPSEAFDLQGTRTSRGPASDLSGMDCLTVEPYESSGTVPFVSTAISPRRSVTRRYFAQAVL
jgi:hypothetical protein